MQTYDLPVFLKIGKDTSKDVFNILDKEFINTTEIKIIFFTSKMLYDIFKDYIDSLLNMRKNMTLFFVEDSSFEIAFNAAKRIALEEYDLIIGFGGGTILDTAKYASYVSERPYIALPTTLSNDGVASPISVLKVSETERRSFLCSSPDGIIVDTCFIINAPKTLLTAGIGDIISNYTALYDWRLEHKIKDTVPNDFACLLSDMSYNSLLMVDHKDLRNEDFIAILSKSVVLSGLSMNIAGSSRPSSGSEHLFSHALDQYYNSQIAHGLKVALGTIGAAILQNRDYNQIVKFFKDLDIDVSPKTLKIDKDMFIDAWMKAMSTRPKRFTVLNTLELNEKLFSKLYDQIVEILE
ncbi:MAG: iron-containing alcohol dehydrogenase family protein [Candidatus Izemoplasmatales bacterium]